MVDLKKIFLETRKFYVGMSGDKKVVTTYWLDYSETGCIENVYELECVTVECVENQKIVYKLFVKLPFASAELYELSNDNQAEFYDMLDRFRNELVDIREKEYIYNEYGIKEY